MIDHKNNADLSIQKLLTICKESLLFYAVFFLPGVLSKPPGSIQESFGSPAFNFYVIILSIPQILLLLYFIKNTADQNPDDFGLIPFRGKDIIHGLYIFAGIYAMLIALSLAVSLLPRSVQGVLASVEPGSFSNPMLLPLVLFTCLATGYREELFFRSYLLTRLENAGMERIWSISVSTALFALGHLYQGYLAILIAIITSLYFSLIFLKTKNIHGISVAHGLYNFSALFLSYILGPLGVNGVTT